MSDNHSDLERKSTILFGCYPQDCNVSRANGISRMSNISIVNDRNNADAERKPIEWIVLEKEDDRALVISKYALDCRPYHSSLTDVSWETCSLRQWLNGDFPEIAFRPDERARILTVTVRADQNPRQKTNAGNDTQDAVFLLNIPEAQRYFSDNNDRSCKPTAYARARGADVAFRRGEAVCWWWLRTPGNIGFDAAAVGHYGAVFFSGLNVTDGSGGIRPAMWIRM